MSMSKPNSGPPNTVETRVIIVGNEKGGSGKTTAAMHLIIALLRSGFKTGAIDLDVRQKSLTRYLENRQNFAVAKKLTIEDLPMPELRVAPHSEHDSRAEAMKIEQQGFAATLQKFASCDFVVVDCPGANTHLSRLAHAYADIIVTPMNDSFVDFDLLARLDPDTAELLGPSVYSQMVWQARQQRKLATEGTGENNTIDWVVMRNRMGAANAKNKKRVGEKLDEFSKRMGFRLCRGFGERVIYREMFPDGLTLLDMGTKAMRRRATTMSHVAARQEIRHFVSSLNLSMSRQENIEPKSTAA